MKQIKFLAFTILFLIAGQLTNAQRTIEDNVSSIEKISLEKIPFEKDVFFEGNKSDFKWDLSNIELVKFKNSPFIGYKVSSLVDKETYECILFFEGKTLALITKINTTENSNSHVEILSSSEEVYFEFDVNEKSLLKNLISINDIDFKSLWQGKRDEFVNEKVVEKKCTDLSFGDCMSCGFKECSDSWQCTIMCGLGAGLALCSVGFAIGCA